MKPRSLTDISDATFGAMVRALERGEAATMGEAYRQVEETMNNPDLTARLVEALRKAAAECASCRDGIAGHYCTDCPEPDGHGGEIFPEHWHSDNKPCPEPWHALLAEAAARPAAAPVREAPVGAPANPAFDRLAAIVARAQATVGAMLVGVQEAAREVAIAASAHGKAEVAREPEAPRRHDCRAALLERTPEGTRLAYLHGDQVIVTGNPPDDEHLPEEERHNCDAMGCSAWCHVVERHSIVKPAPAAPQPAPTVDALLDCLTANVVDGRRVVSNEMLALALSAAGSDALGRMEAAVKGGGR